MSIALMSEVWGLELSHDRKLVLLALADHADDDGSNCFPTVGRVAWKTDYSTRQVRRIMRALEEDGLLISVDSKRGGRGMGNQFVIDLAKGVRKSAFMPKKTRTDATQKADTQDRKADTAMSAEPSEPSINLTSDEEIACEHQTPICEECREKNLHRLRELVQGLAS